MAPSNSKTRKSRFLAARFSCGSAAIRRSHRKISPRRCACFFAILNCPARRANCLKFHTRGTGATSYCLDIWRSVSIKCGIAATTRINSQPGVCLSRCCISCATKRNRRLRRTICRSKSCARGSKASFRGLGIWTKWRAKRIFRVRSWRDVFARISGRRRSNFWAKRGSKTRGVCCSNRIGRSKKSRGFAGFATARTFPTLSKNRRKSRPLRCENDAEFRGEIASRVPSREAKNF